MRGRRIGGADRDPGGAQTKEEGLRNPGREPAVEAAPPRSEGVELLEPPASPPFTDLVTIGTVAGDRRGQGKGPPEIEHRG